MIKFIKLIKEKRLLKNERQNRRESILPIYTELYEGIAYKSSENYFVVQQNDKYGIMSNDYIELIKCIYDDIWMGGSEGVNDDVIKIMQNDKEGLMANNLEIVLIPTYKFLGAIDHGLVVASNTKVYNGTSGGLYYRSDIAGIKTSYDGKVYRFKEFGLIDYFGNILIDFRYDSINFETLNDDILRIDCCIDNIGVVESYNFSIHTGYFERIGSSNNGIFVEIHPSILCLGD